MEKTKTIERIIFREGRIGEVFFIRELDKTINLKKGEIIMHRESPLGTKKERNGDYVIAEIRNFHTNNEKMKGNPSQNYFIREYHAIKKESEF